MLLFYEKIKTFEKSTRSKKETSKLHLPSIVSKYISELNHEQNIKKLEHTKQNDKQRSNSNIIMKSDSGSENRKSLVSSKFTDSPSYIQIKEEKVFFYYLC